MNLARHLCAALGLLSVMHVNASEGPYPEVFDEFITGWVDYDDGYYAAALRAFARAHALDPDFRPATEAMASSLGQMGMPEIGEAILRDRWVSKGNALDYRPAIAFWGVFHSAEIDRVSTAGLEEAVTDALDNLVDLPVVLTSPSRKTWAERKNQSPCAYNLLIFLRQEADQSATARIHLIRNYSIASGKELDLALSTIPTQVGHQQFEIHLAPGDIAQLPKNQAFNQGILELFDPNVAMENPDYRLDPETEALLAGDSAGDPWLALTKASVSKEFALANYRSIKDFYRSHRGNGPVMAAVGPGFPEWLAHQLATSHPMRPWLLAEADRENMSSQRWYPGKAGRIRGELKRDHPDHPALVAVQLCREVWGLHHLNYEEKMPRIQDHLAQLRRLPPDLFSHARDLEYLERFDKTVRACLGLPVSEPFVPFVISGGAQQIANDGSFRISFRGKAPKLLQVEIDTIGEPQQFALTALIDQMANITDTKVLLSTYKAHVDREDDLGAYLRRIKNGVMWRFKCGPKDIYKEACEWWIQRAVALIDSGADWKEVSGNLPSYLAFSDHNQPLLEAMNRRLEQRGLLAIKENVTLAYNCPQRWKISFLDLSGKSQDVVIRYHRDRAASDFESYLRLLAWLNWSDAEELFHAEALYAWKDYVRALRKRSDHEARIELACEYMQLLIVAGEPKLALDACRQVFADVNALRQRGEGSDPDIIYNLRTSRVEALIGVGRSEEASQEIDRILQELDGRLVNYREKYIYSLRKTPGHISLSSVLLDLKAAIEQQG